MRPLKLAVFASALLLCSGGRDWGMGSGPHPHLLTELPPPPPLTAPAVDAGASGLSSTTAVVFFLGGGIALALLIGTVRLKEKSAFSDA